MAKPGTASTLSIAQFREFGSAMLRNIPDDLDPAFVQDLIEHQDKLRERLQHAFAAPPTSRLIKVLTITCVGDKTASQLRQLGKYDWSNELITDERFPLVPHDPWSHQIGLVELDDDWSWDQGRAALAAHGLEPPTAEDGLYFGIQHPEEQRKRPVVFPHKPVRDALGGPDVLVLHGSADDRKLRLYCCAHEWYRRCVVAGVRKVA